MSSCDVKFRWFCSYFQSVSSDCLIFPFLLVSSRNFRIAWLWLRSCNRPPRIFPRLFTLPSKVGFGVDSVFIDGVNVVFWRLEGSELRAQVTVLAAVGTSGAWENKRTDVRDSHRWMNNKYSQRHWCDQMSTLHLNFLKVHNNKFNSLKGLNFLNVGPLWRQ